jgi:hypothetical protein
VRGPDPVLNLIPFVPREPHSLIEFWSGKWDICLLLLSLSGPDNSTSDMQAPLY